MTSAFKHIGPRKLKATIQIVFSVESTLLQCTQIIWWFPLYTAQCTHCKASVLVIFSLCLLSYIDKDNFKIKVPLQSSGQRELFFQSRDENESLSNSISFIETRPRIPDTLRLRDETEKKIPPISGIETRSKFIIFTLRLRDENENSLDLISFFETRPRILKIAIFP